MSHLLFLKVRGDDYRHAPEFEYLLGWCIAQSKRVFERVSTSVVDDRAPSAPETGDVDAVLLVGRDNVLLGQASQRRMAERLTEGASIVVPRALESTDLAKSHSLFTLRDFEIAEAEYLEEHRALVPEPAPLLPVALLDGAAFHRLLQRRSLVELLEAPELDAATEGLGLVAGAGLYHRFVDYYGVERADILPFVPEGAQTVLEIGCGRGGTGRLLTRERDCEVVGVELNPVVASEAARHLHRVVAGNVLELDFEAEFDVVLALELFEHLTDSETFLERARSWLRPGGRIVLSVPNVGHYSVVSDLLAGRWDYLPIGLLCYTHYRFFTRATLEDWLRRCGFERFEIVAQRTDVPEEVRSRFERLRASAEIDADSLATSGFYVVIEP